MDNKFPNLDKFHTRLKEYNIENFIVIDTYAALLLTSVKLIGKMESYLRKLKISNSQFIIMIILLISESDSETPSSLSDKTGLTRPTISTLIASLYKNNFIEKKSIPNNKKSYQIVLTQNGKKIINDIIPGYYSKIDFLFKDFEKDELTNLRLLILKLLFIIKFL